MTARTQEAGRNARRHEEFCEDRKKINFDATKLNKPMHRVRKLAKRAPLR